MYALLLLPREQVGHTFLEVSSSKCYRESEIVTAFEVW